MHWPPSPTPKGTREGRGGNSDLQCQIFSTSVNSQGQWNKAEHSYVEKQPAKKVKSIPPPREGEGLISQGWREDEAPLALTLFRIEKRGLHANIIQLLQLDNSFSLATISEQCCSTRFVTAQKRKRLFLFGKCTGCRINLGVYIYPFFCFPQTC